MTRPYGPPRRRQKAGSGWLITALALMFFIGTGRQALAADAIKILALGDSLTAGYGLAEGEGFVPQLQAALRARGHEVTVINGGVSGDTTAGGLARMDWMLADKPDAAIVELGANDGLRGTDPKQTEANLTAILEQLSDHHIPVLFSGMYALTNLGPDYGREFRAVFDRLGHRPGVLYDPFFLDGVALHPELFQPDGLHPTKAGVQIIVARILPLAEKLIAEVPR